MRTIAMLKGADAVFGRLALAIMPAARPAARPAQIRRVLFIRPGGIGDAVLLVPAIKAVKQVLPDVSIDVLGEKRNVSVFELTQDVTRVLCYERPAELLTAIKGSYDVVIDTEQWHRLSAVVARLVRASITVGFATNDRRKLFTHPTAYSHGEYEVHSFLALIEVVVGRTVFDPFRPFFVVPDRYRTAVEPHLRPFSGRRVVALFPGGTIAERRWGSERFHRVAEELSSRGYGVVAIGGKEDIPAGDEIVRGISGGVNLCGRLSLPETAAVVSLSTLLVSGDSGIMHLGYAAGARVVALFGPGIEQKWAPRSSRAIVISKRLACSPCTKYGYTPRCPINAECMKRITVEEVLEKVREMMSR